MSTSLVRLSVEDYDEVCALWQAAGLPFKPAGRESPENFATQMASGIQVLFGIRENGQLVGVAVATHDTRKGWINRIAVHPDYRRQGVAAALIEACEAHFEQLGLLIFAALVEGENEASLALFQSEGYHVHQTVKYLSKRPSNEV